MQNHTKSAFFWQNHTKSCKIKMQNHPFFMKKGYKNTSFLMQNGTKVKNMQNLTKSCKMSHFLVKSSKNQSKVIIARHLFMYLFEFICVTSYLIENSNGIKKIKRLVNANNVHFVPNMHAY